MLTLLLLIPSIIFLIIGVRVRIRKIKCEFFPPVSLIAWTWKGGNVIKRKIENFLSQDYPGKFEIIIVDNASKDETESICRKYERRGLIKYYRTKKEYGKKAYGLNESIEKIAKYDIIAITDPDGVCEKNWLKKIVQPFKDENVGAVIGLTHCGNFYVNFFTKLRAVEDEWNYNIVPLGTDFEKSIHLICGANHAVRRRALKSVGYYGKKTLGEDLELTVKLYDKGWDVKVVDANVWQEEVETVKEYFRQRLRWIDSGIEVSKYYFRQLLSLFKKRTLGLFLFYFSFSLHFFSLFYILLALFTRFKIIGLIGFLICNLGPIVGLIRLKRTFLVPYVPFYLLLEPLFTICCIILRKWFLIKGKRIVWKSLNEKYYHKGRRIVMK